MSAGVRGGPDSMPVINIINNPQLSQDEDQGWRVRCRCKLMQCLPLASKVFDFYLKNRQLLTFPNLRKHSFLNFFFIQKILQSRQKFLLNMLITFLFEFELYLQEKLSLSYSCSVDHFIRNFSHQNTSFRTKKSFNTFHKQLTCVEMKNCAKHV